MCAVRYQFIESPVFAATDWRTTSMTTSTQRCRSTCASTPRPAHWCGALAACASCAGRVRVAASLGGVRVCYYVRTLAGQILMLVIYANNVRDSIPGHVLAALRRELEHGQDE